MAFNFIKFIISLFKDDHNPPPPPPPVDPPQLEVHIVCRPSSGGEIITPAGGQLILDNNTILTATLQNFLLIFKLPKDVPYGWGATLTVRAEGFEPSPQRIVLAPDINVTLNPTITFLPPLKVNGKFFEMEDGTPIHLKEATGFRAYELFLRMGPNYITPFLQERQNMKGNLIRVWLLNTSVGTILPGEWGSKFYDLLPTFVQTCAKFGQYVEFTLFTQTQTLMPKLEDQQNHVNKVYDALHPVFCLIEGVNENDQHDNAIDPRLNLSKPAGAAFIVCGGSNGADSAPNPPHLDYVAYHSNDLSEWWRKPGHNTMEYADNLGKPGLANENTRPDHDVNPKHHQDAAEAAALLCAGYCFHCNPYKDARPTDPASIDRYCAIATSQGMEKVPARFHYGTYTHESGMEDSTIIRAYSRTLPTGEKYVVKIGV